MKNLIFLLVAGAFVAVGGVFFGAWEISGLEKMPTMQSLAKSRSNSGESNPEEKAARRLEMGSEAQRPAGYFATGTGSATTNRNRHLQNQGKEINGE